MSGSGSGKGSDNRGNRRRPFKRRDRDNNQRSREGQKGGGKNKADASPFGGRKSDKKRGPFIDRPKWVPPQPPAVPMPTANCAWCDKPIKDISAAISEPDTGKPVHFDCIINRIIERETLENGDAVSYIGGGRFGIVHFSNPPDTRDFKIKKVFEWENKEIRSEWRVTLSEHYSVT